MDYILVERFLEQYVEDCRVANEFYFETNHRLLIASFKTPSTKKARWRERQPKKRNLNVKALKQPIIRTAIVEAVNRQFQICDTDSVNSKNVSENITINLTKIAEEILHATQKAIINEVSRDDGVFNQLINDRARCDSGTERHKELAKSLKTSSL